MIVNRRTLIASAAVLAAAPGCAQEATPALRRMSPKLDRIVASDAPIEVIATDIKWAEGPTWVKQGNYLLFSDVPNNAMWRWSRADGAKKFLEPSGTPGLDPKLVREAGSNGLAIDAQGRLLIANSGGGSIERLDLKTRQRTVLAREYAGKRLSSCNDMTVSRTGAIYFTDPPYGFAQGDASPLKAQKQNGVYRWTPDGKVVLIEGGLTKPNGIALSPNEKRLFVSNSDPKDFKIMAFDLDAHGLPIGSHVFMNSWPTAGKPGSPDGMKIAADGTMFCSGPGGMWIFAPDGEKLGLIEDGGPIANCCFGDNGSTLYMAANHRVLRMPLKINGWRA